MFINKIQRKNPVADMHNLQFYILATAEEPQKYTEAVSSDDSKNWQKAMDEEMESHKTNGTWELIR